MKIGIHLQIIFLLLSTMIFDTSVYSLSVQRERLKRFTFAQNYNDFNDENCGPGLNTSESHGKCRVNLILHDPARHATNIALKAAQEAKKANEDMGLAVSAAAHKVKLEYAEKAAYAAKAAEAALAGKQQIVEQLENEVREGEIIVQEEVASIAGAEENFNMANKAVDLAKCEFKVLNDALKLAKENFEISDLVCSAGKESLLQKQNLFEAAKNRVLLLLRQLKEARQDFENTKKAAVAAACAAQEAKQRSERTRRWACRRTSLQKITKNVNNK